MPQLSFLNRERHWVTCVIAKASTPAQMGIHMKAVGTRACGTDLDSLSLPEALCMREIFSTTMPMGEPTTLSYPPTCNAAGVCSSSSACHIYRRLPCRNGKAKYENGGVYDGEFENDQRNGWGSHCFPDESFYQGEWAQDKIDGASLQHINLSSQST